MTLQVAIIGGGMAGLAHALALKKHGISSEIFEVRDESYSKGGNIALAPNALRVMDHIGIYDKLRIQGYNYEELAFSNGSGQELGKLLNGSQKEYNFPALRIHRAIVREELIKAVKERGITIHWNKKVVGVKEETEKSAIVEFASGETIEAEFVIGADGIHSKIRPFFAPHAIPEYSGLMGVMGHVDKAELNSLNQEKHMYLPAMLFGATGSFAIMPASFDGSEVGYFATIEEPDHGRDGWPALENDKNELFKMLESRFLPKQYKWPELVQELCEKTPKDSLTSWPFFSVPHLDSWTSAKGRVILIGDSAHAIPPTGGQGAAMAFEDAETLAYALSRILIPPPNPPQPLEELKKWEAHRTKRIVKVMDFTSKNGQLRKSSPHIYEQAAKEWLIWAVFHLQGEKAGAEPLYSYNAESVLACL